jgi:hypothetical protein
MADALESTRQDVKEKAAQELDRVQPHPPLPVAVRIIFQQLLGNLRRKGFVPIRGYLHDVRRRICAFL